MFISSSAAEHLICWWPLPRLVQILMSCINFSQVCGRKNISRKHQYCCCVSNRTAGINTEPERPGSILTFLLLNKLYSVNKRASPSSSCHKGNYSLLYSIVKCYLTRILHLLPADLGAALSFMVCIYLSFYFYSIFISILTFHSFSLLQNYFPQQQLLLAPFLLLLPQHSVSWFRGRRQ